MRSFLRNFVQFVRQMRASLVRVGCACNLVDLTKKAFAVTLAVSNLDRNDSASRCHQSKYPDLAAEFKRRMSGQLPAGWKDKLPKFTPEVCTVRVLAHRCLSALAFSAMRPQPPVK